jgi:hypothetical protein
MSALPGSSDVDLFRYGEGIIDFDSRYLTVLSILVRPSRSCTARSYRYVGKSVALSVVVSGCRKMWV